ncbi:MAG: DNA (cytosine-5-)-methyltransferase [bacterium]|nr:DNA (cytosine-5-)-methyltransferase [bacterium]
MQRVLFDAQEIQRRSVDDEFQACNLGGVTPPDSLRVAGLFAGIGGIEVGLHEAGASTELLCEWWEPAQAVLAERFPDVPLVGDVRELDHLPDVDLVAAGFPCTDLSQAGRTRGITGEASGLVAEVFRLLKDRRVPLLLLENVRNMLVLDKGEAMRFLVDELESLGYRWAYRLVDSRFTGVPQRRQRVIFLAALDLDPRSVLFADEAGEPDDDHYRDEAFGFYWTEGVRGLGWAKDALPTLKGGSTIGIPSPPAIWNPGGRAGVRIITPSIQDAEQMQGLAAGWTEPAAPMSRGEGTRWKLVGNAVTVGVSRWVGERLMSPGQPFLDGQPLERQQRWPVAAYGAKGKAWAVDLSLWPRQERYLHLSDVVEMDQASPLSARAAAGFYSRTQKGSLRFVDQFIVDVAEHAALMAEELAAVASCRRCNRGWA